MLHTLERIHASPHRRAVQEGAHGSLLQDTESPAAVRPLRARSAPGQALTAPGPPGFAGSRLARASELLLVFLVLPVLFRGGLLPFPKLAVLLAVTGVCGLALWRSSTFDRRLLTGWRQAWAARRGIGLRASLAALVVIAVVTWRHGPLLELPRTRPLQFAAILLLYPVFSAWPQELVYRASFFHRYGAMLGERGVLLGSAIAFGVLHVVYADPVAPALALPAGLALASTCRRSGSLVAATVEHALFGLAVFTFGLGRSFVLAHS